MAPAGHSSLAHWQFPLFLTGLLVAIAILYIRGQLRLRSTSTSKNTIWQHLYFASGLLLIWAALGSPMAAMDHQLLSIHMAKHLLLMTIAPALILLADPVRTLASGLPQGAYDLALLPILRWPPVRSLGRFFANPIVCWLAATGVLLGWHVPAFFSLALRSPIVHSIEHFSFVFAGFLFWWPVIQPWPAIPLISRWPILIYLFLATLPCDILSAYLTFCDHVVYIHYLNLAGTTPSLALRDQEFAGALMWTCVTVIYLIPAGILTVRLLSPQQNRVQPPCG